MRRSVGITTIKVEQYDVLVEYKGYWTCDGIGKYEFWGALCFDKGREYLVVDQIIPLFTDETTEQIYEIQGLIDKNFDEYAEQISDLHGEEE
jgi:hypothetical protein